jgi:hypothetical protein
MPKTYKHALLMFSKPPVPGLVKTRLTREKGGPFSAEDAAAFFHRSLFDVMELCIRAVSELEAENATAIVDNPDTPNIEYGFFISTTPAENVDIMRKTFEDAGDWGRKFT